MRMRISYPSGAQFDVVGLWHRPLPENEFTPLITIRVPLRVANEFLNRGELLVCDPRAVIQDRDTLAILYNPRQAVCYVGLEQVMRDWLDEHPEWPNVLEIEGLEEDMPKAAVTYDQVPGALINGTRVEKTRTEDGDGHEDGALGSILGSTILNDCVMYCIEWDDLPRVPIWIEDSRILPT